MKISISTYGNMVTVDHRSHAVGLDLGAMFPGVAHIHYDTETGVGAIEYIPTPSHTFYGMDGLKNLGDVLKAWDSEDASWEKARITNAEDEKATALKVAEEQASLTETTVPAQEIASIKQHHDTRLAEELNPAQAQTARKRDADARAKASEAVSVVIEDE